MWFFTQNHQNTILFKHTEPFKMKKESFLVIYNVIIYAMTFVHLTNYV